MAARTRAAKALAGSGIVIFTAHALRKLKKDELTTVDAENVIRAGTWREAEWENGAWRYNVDTPRMAVVIELQDPNVLVITAFRRRKP